MNALELADSLMSWAEEVYGGGAELKEAATMLRQQQAEIEALKERIAFLEDKTIMVEPLDDSHYPFRAILRKSNDK